MDMQQLRSELAADPAGMGYAQHLPQPLSTPLPAGFDAALAEIMNDRTRRTVTRAQIPAKEVKNAIFNAAGFDDVPAATLQRIEFAMSSDPVQMTGLGEVATGIGSRLAPYSTVKSAFDAVKTRPGSRAEELDGEYALVTDLDVRRAVFADDGSRLI